jgi:hypothetical protein
MIHDIRIDSCGSNITRLDDQRDRESIEQSGRFVTVVCKVMASRSEKVVLTH